MKKIIAGIGFELTGTLMLLCSSLIASMSMENTTEWNTKLGVYWQTVFNGLISCADNRDYFIDNRYCIFFMGRLFKIR